MDGKQRSEESVLTEFLAFYCFGKLYERGMIVVMTIGDLIVVVSLALTAFGLTVYR